MSCAHVSNIRYAPMQVYLLGEAQRDVCGLVVALEEIAVKRSLLNHGRVELVSGGPEAFDLGVSVDDSLEDGLLAIFRRAGQLVEDVGGWESADEEVVSKLHISLVGCGICASAVLTPRCSSFGAA